MVSKNKKTKISKTDQLYWNLQFDKWKKKNDIDNLTQKHLLYNLSNGAAMVLALHHRQVTWTIRYIKSYFWRVTILTSYVTKDSKITLHSLPKEAATKKLRLRFSAHALGEYLYIVAKNGLTLRHRTYAINQTDKDLLE